MGKRTTVTSQTDRIRAVATREAVTGLYNGTLQPADIAHRFPHISRRRATELSSKLPKNLVDNENTLELTRAVNMVVGLPNRCAYTTWELQQATAKYTAKKLTAKECTEKYGVGGSTLRAKRKGLGLCAKEGEKAPDLSVAHRAAKHLKRQKTRP